MIDSPVLERVLSEALRHGGEFAEVFAEDKSTSSAMLDDGRVEELSSGRERGAGIRVVSGETTGFAHTADLSEEGLLRAADAASAVATQETLNRDRACSSPASRPSELAIRTWRREEPHPAWTCEMAPPDARAASSACRSSSRVSAFDPRELPAVRP